MQWTTLAYTITITFIMYDGHGEMFFTIVQIMYCVISRYVS
jgi:hypothetical protein